MENDDSFKDLEVDEITDEFLGLAEPEHIQYSEPQLNITEMQVARLNLTPGEILAVVIKTDDVSEELVGSVKANIQKLFPGNRVLIFGIGLGDSIQFSKIGVEKEILANKELSSCNTGNFCADCNCGKKEQFEGNNNV